MKKIPLPLPATLKRYGLTEVDYIKLYKSQYGQCALCKNTNRKLVVDHRHVQGYKFMAPEKKRRYIRGLLCSFCNRRIATKLHTLERTKTLSEYLQAFEERLKQYE